MIRYAATAARRARRRLVPRTKRLVVLLPVTALLAYTLITFISRVPTLHLFTFNFKVLNVSWGTPRQI